MIKFCCSDVMLAYIWILMTWLTGPDDMERLYPRSAIIAAGGEEEDEEVENEAVSTKLCTLPAFDHFHWNSPLVRVLFCAGLWWEDKWGDGGTPQCCSHWGWQWKFNRPGRLHCCRYLWQGNQHGVHVLSSAHHQEETPGGQ